MSEMLRHKYASKADKRKIYKEITKDIICWIKKMIKDEEKGKKVRWIKPWSPTGVLHANVQTPYRPYSMINQLICAKVAMEKGYKSRFWITQNRIMKLGGHLLSDQSPTEIIASVPKNALKKKNENFEPKIPTSPLEENGNSNLMLKPEYILFGISVYNIEQCEGLKLKEVKPKSKPEIHVTAQQTIDKMPCKPLIVHEAIDEVYYSLLMDSIHLPVLECFKSTAHLYDTLFHELAHSTSHIRRLNRVALNLAYDQEEFVAEFASTFVMNACGFAHEREVIKNEVVYLKSWLKIFSKKPESLAVYAALAEKAANFIFGKGSRSKFSEREKLVSKQDIDFMGTVNFDIPWD